MRDVGIECENIYCLRASSCANEPTDKIILLALRLDCSCSQPAKVSRRPDLLSSCIGWKPCYLLKLACLYSTAFS